MSTTKLGRASHKSLIQPVVTVGIRKHVHYKIRKSQPQVTNTTSSNCRNKETCPLQNKCMSKDIVYKATISTCNTNDTKHYIGMTSNTFKERFRNHIKSFNHKKYSNETELSKYVWHLKENNTDYTIKWSIIKNSISYTGGSKRCNLCSEEKRFRGLEFRPAIITIDSR